MTTQKQSFIAQATVAIIVGLLSSLGTGMVTTYVMTNKFDKKLDAHITNNASEYAQVRRDIARIEQDNIIRERRINTQEDMMHKLVTDIAVIRTKVEAL